MRLIIEVARLSLIDRLRDRRVLVAEAAPSLLLLVVLVAINLQGASSDRGGDDRDSFRVGVVGDVDQVDGLERRLAAHHLDVVAVDDPQRSVLQEEVEAALVVPTDDPADATVIDRVGSDGSRVAGLLLRVALADQRRALDGAGPVVAVQQPDRERDLPAPLVLMIPILPLVFAGGAGRAVVERLTGARAVGHLEVQLALPLPRRQLLGGYCLAEVALSLARETVVLAPSVLAVGVVGAVVQGPVAGVLAATLVVLAVVAQAVVMAVLGVLAAAGNAVCAFIVKGPTVVVAMFLLVWSRGEPGPMPWVMSMLPGAGLSVSAREVIAGNPAGAPFALGLVATVAALALVGRRAARALGSEALVVASHRP